VAGGKGMGGGVFNMSGRFSALASTFAANTADYDGDAIYNLVYDSHKVRTAQTTLRDSIVTGAAMAVDLVSNKTTYIVPSPLGTANADVSRFDIVRTMFARGQGTITGSPLMTDPLLGPLALNGGPTATMAIAPGSPAIDGVPTAGAGCPATDQRGVRRPQGRRCDNGAFEGAPRRQPDAEIKLGADSSFLGVGLWNTTATDQTRSASAARTHSRTFDLRFRNDGLLEGRISAKGCRSSSGFNVRYSKGSTDVTSAVVDGSYRTPTLGNHAASSLTLKIAIGPAATIGTTKSCAVRATSVAAPARVDVVKAQVKVSG
jgi:hypothetical protein